MVGSKDETYEFTQNQKVILCKKKTFSKGNLKQSRQPDQIFLAALTKVGPSGDTDLGSQIWGQKQKS